MHPGPIASRVNSQPCGSLPWTTPITEATMNNKMPLNAISRGGTAAARSPSSLGALIYGTDVIKNTNKHALPPRYEPRETDEAETALVKCERNQARPTV